MPRMRTAARLALLCLLFAFAGGPAWAATWAELKGRFDQEKDKDFSIYLVRDQLDHRRSPRHRKRQWEYLYCLTPTGYVNTPAYLACMRRFSAIWHRDHPGLWCYILADRLKVHLDAAVIREMLGEQIFFIYFAANATHFLQPLDGTVFAAFKQRFGDQLYERVECPIYPDVALPGFPNALLGMAAFAGRRMVMDLGAGRLSVSRALELTVERGR